jgi:hypothetical protein
MYDAEAFRETRSHEGIKLAAGAEERCAELSQTRDLTREGAVRTVTFPLSAAKSRTPQQ